MAKDERGEQGETERELEEKARRWMKAGKELGVYVVCKGRSLRWRELARLEEGMTAEVPVELKGGAGKKRAKKRNNPWNSPSSESEQEKVRSESSSAGETDKKIQEELEKKVAQAMEEGGVLEQLVDDVGGDGRTGERGNDAEV